MALKRHNLQPGAFCLVTDDGQRYAFNHWTGAMAAAPGTPGLWGNAAHIKRLIEEGDLVLSALAVEDGL